MVGPEFLHNKSENENNKKRKSEENQMALRATQKNKEIEAKIITISNCIWWILQPGNNMNVF